MPIRSPRRLYEFEEITSNLDDNPDAIDQAPGETEDGLKRNLFVKMKEGIGDYFGLEPIEYTDPRLTGTFGGDGTNKGALYRKNIGGFKVASYTLIAESFFTIKEKYYNPFTKQLIEEEKDFRTMSIGLPKGHSVNEFIFWLGSVADISAIAAIRTPKGRKIDLYLATPGG